MADAGELKLHKMIMQMQKDLEKTLKEKGVRKPNGSTLVNFKVFKYEPADDRVEEGKTYHYPEMMGFNIESRNTYKLTMRGDGMIVDEGKDLNGPGIPPKQIIDEVVEEIKDWSEMVKKHDEPAPKLKPGKWKQLKEPDKYFNNLILHATYGDGWGANVFMHGTGFWVEIHNGYDSVEKEYVKRDMSKTFGDYSYVKEAADRLHEKVVHRYGLPKVSAMPRETNAMLAKLDPKKYPALAGAFKNLTIAEGPGDKRQEVEKLNDSDLEKRYLEKSKKVGNERLRKLHPEDAREYDLLLIEKNKRFNKNKKAKSSNENPLDELVKEAKALEDKHESELTDPEKNRLKELGKEIEVQKMENEKKIKSDAQETEAGAQEKKIIDMWIMGRGGDFGGAPMQVWAQGPLLYSYNTIIAKFVGKKLFVNSTKYSNTTTKLISHLKSMAAEQNIPVVEKEEAFFKTSMPQKLDFGAPAHRSKIRPATGSEDEDDMEAEPDEEDVFIQPHGQLGSQYSVGTQHKHIGVFNDMEDAEKAIKEWMEKNKFWPNVWFVSDHGNISPHSIGASIVKAEFELDVTYDVVTDESAKRGDFEESGYESEGLKFDSLAEMALYMHEHGASGEEQGGEASWYTADPDIDYSSGNETMYGFHVQTDLTPEQKSELQLYMDMDEQELRKLVKEGSVTEEPAAMDMESAKEKWIIKDWAGNHCFPKEEFNDFEDAWGFLYEKYPEDEEALQEYEVVKAQVTAAGEPDQDYDHEVFDAIVKALEAKGYKAIHREFDKYQGVYLDVSKGGKPLDKFWIADSYVRGTPKKNPNVKYKSAVLIDEEGNESSATRGDYFQMADDDVFDGAILVLTDKNGKESTIENPKKSDLPDLLEVSNTMEYEGKPDVVIDFVAESQGENAEPLEVEVTPEGHADISDLLGFLGKEARE